LRDRALLFRWLSIRSRLGFPVRVHACMWLRSFRFFREEFKTNPGPIYLSPVPNSRSRAGKCGGRSPRVKSQYREDGVARQPDECCGRYDFYSVIQIFLRKKGLEPLRPFGHQLLRLARLPIPPLPRRLARSIIQASRFQGTIRYMRLSGTR
jgi:hypothetical protein